MLKDKDKQYWVEYDSKPSNWDKYFEDVKENCLDNAYSGFDCPYHHNPYTFFILRTII